MPTLTLPRAARALTIRPRHPAPGTPTPAPSRVPGPRRPTATAPAVVVAVPVRAALAPAPARVVADPGPPALCLPQAQGDVIVLPWLDFMSPHIRALHTATAVPVGRGGLVVHPTHVLVPEGAAVFWAWWPGDGPTLGTLVVPDASVARLAHDEHADLRIGPGVYAVRRLRRAELRGMALVND